MLIHDSDINIISEKKIFIKFKNKKIQNSWFKHEIQVYIIFTDVIKIFFVHWFRIKNDYFIIIINYLSFNLKNSFNFYDCKFIMKT